MDDVAVCFDVDDYGVMTDSAECRALLTSQMLVCVRRFGGVLDDCGWFASRDLVGENDGGERNVREQHPALFGALKLLRVEVAVHNQGCRVEGALRD